MDSVAETAVTMGEMSTKSSVSSSAENREKEKVDNKVLKAGNVVIIVENREKEKDDNKELNAHNIVISKNQEEEDIESKLMTSTERITNVVLIGQEEDVDSKEVIVTRRISSDVIIEDNEEEEDDSSCCICVFCILCCSCITLCSGRCVSLCRAFGRGCCGCLKCCGRGSCGCLKCCGRGCCGCFSVCGATASHCFGCCCACLVFCGGKFARTVMIATSVIILLLGIVVITIGKFIYVAHREISGEDIMIFMVVFGIASMIAALQGMLGAWNRSTVCLSCNSFTILVLIVGISIVFIHFEVEGLDVRGFLETRWLDLTNYERVTVQNNFECCGFNYRENYGFPCPTQGESVGCVDVLEDFLNERFVELTALTATVTTLFIVMLLLNCGIIKGIRSEQGVEKKKVMVKNLNL